MFVDYTDAQRQLQREVRGYFRELIPPEIRDELEEHGVHTELGRRIRRQMGRDGWLGVGWPREYGGRGMSALEQFIFYDEARKAAAPLPFISLNTVGPTLMAYGSEEQRERFLPGILRGELDFAIGYTEPEAGTDLAALTTRAVPEGDHYVVNGQKVFTSGADVADYIWLAVRTDPQAPKHKGISILIVDAAADGLSIRPLRTIAGSYSDTTFTYYEDVRVPRDDLVYRENEGWTLITTQLNHERVGMAANSSLYARLFEDVVAWATTEVTADGARLVDVPWVQSALGRLHARLEALKLNNWAMASAIDRGELTAGQASMVKVQGTETAIEVARVLLDIVGQQGGVRQQGSGAVLNGRLEKAYRRAIVGTFGGGNNAVQREIIASRALGMPRSRPA